MPNRSNVTAPINIHGFGRSGTTVLQNLLGQTGFIQVCNETAPLVFNCYRGGELLLPSHDKESPGLPGDGSAAVQAVHSAFCGAVPSSKHSWCQKLGGIPNSVVWELLITDEDRAYAATPYAFPYGWYWKVLGSCFPHARHVLILRDWRDIVASRVDYSGFEATDVARDLAVYWQAMAHPAARIDHVIRMKDLAGTPHQTVHALFAALGLQYQESYLRALDWYASSRGRDLVETRKTGFSRRASFERFDKRLQRRLETTMQPALDRLRHALREP